MGYVVVIIAVVFGIIAYCVTDLSFLQVIGLTVIGLISTFPMFLPWAIRVSAEAERQKRLDELPDKIILNIKYESEDDEDDDKIE